MRKKILILALVAIGFGATLTNSADAQTIRRAEGAKTSTKAEYKKAPKNAVKTTAEVKTKPTVQQTTPSQPAIRRVGETKTPTKVERKAIAKKTTVVPKKTTPSKPTSTRYEHTQNVKSVSEKKVPMQTFLNPITDYLRQTQVLQKQSALEAKIAMGQTTYTNKRGKQMQVDLNGLQQKLKQIKNK